MAGAAVLWLPAKTMLESLSFLWAQGQPLGSSGPEILKPTILQTDRDAAIRNHISHEFWKSHSYLVPGHLWTRGATLAAKAGAVNGVGAAQTEVARPRHRARTGEVGLGLHFQDHLHTARLFPVAPGRMRRVSAPP